MRHIVSALLKNIPLHQQVEELVRSRITSGEFAPGSRLPSTSAIAKMTGTSVFTVQTALVRLCGDGLLIRQANRATYVKGAKPALSRVGVYFNRPLSQGDLMFYQALGQKISCKLAEKGVRVRLWADERDESQQGDPPATLKREIERHGIQALLAPLVCADDLEWIKKVPLPTALMSAQPQPNGVQPDYPQMIRLGLKALRDQGCRNVGVIATIMPNPGKPDSAENLFFESIAATAAELDLKIRPEWMRCPEEFPTSFPRYGYGEMQALWDLKQRPEGLLVYPDIAATGVIAAILDRGISVPGKLKLVVHANDLVPYLCPVPATILMSKVGDFADALIQSIETQMGGGEVKLVRIPFSVISPNKQSLSSFATDPREVSLSH